MPAIDPPPDSPPPPPALLVFELAETIAVYVLRLQAVATLWQDPQAIAQPLNVFSRATSPGLTQAALLQLPHVDLDFASVRFGNVDLLQFMLDWFNNKSDSKARPLQYHMKEHNDFHWQPKGKNPFAVDVASAKGLVHVLSWWFKHSSELFFEWTEAAIDEASANGDLITLNWWLCESGLPLSELKWSAAAIDQASGNGLDHVLDWWLKSSGLHFRWLKFSERAMGLAAANGHMTTLKWWLSCGLQIKAHDVVDYAASKDRLDVLEWCWLQPIILEQTWFGRSQQVSDIVTGAIERGNHTLIVWFEGLKFLHSRYDVQCWAAASKAAAKKGDMVAIRWLAANRWLVGSRAQLVNLAAASGNILAMESLHYHLGPGNHMSSWSKTETDGFVAATQSGCIDVLDRLMAHGYRPH